jgi:hypothetical protein
MLALAGLLLAGCGQTPPSATPPPASPGGEEAVGIPGDATIGEGIPNLTTEPEPPRTTLGDLAARMDAAWPRAAAYRAVYTGSNAAQSVERAPAVAPGATPVLSATPLAPAPGATPAVATTPGATPAPVGSGRPLTTLEVVRPDRVRQVVVGAGANDHEAVVIGDQVYVRGPLAAVLSPGASPQGWLVLPAAAVAAAAGDEDDPAAVLAAVLSPPESPLSGLPGNLLPQEPRDLGPVDVNGRACRAWGAANTTPTGERLDITIAMDGDGLPCSVETRKGTEVLGTVVWEAFGEPLTIEAPVGATPVAAPAATPGPGRD